MINLIYSIVYLVACYGLTVLLVFYGGPFNILKGIRLVFGKFTKLLDCPICTSTWVGMTTSLANFFLLPSVLITPWNVILHSTGLWWLIMLLDAFTLVALVYLLEGDNRS